MRILTLFLIGFIAGCSDGGVSEYWDPTHAKSTGLVFVCSDEGITNQFAYTADDIAEVIEYWQMEGGQIIRREREVWIGSGRVGAPALFDEGSYATINYSPLNDEVLSYDGALAGFRWLAVIEGTNNVAGGYNGATGQVDVFNCRAEEYSIATVDGLLIAASI